MVPVLGKFRAGYGEFKKCREFKRQLNQYLQIKIFQGNDSVGVPEHCHECNTASNQVMVGKLNDPLSI
jgi:hypothetical protein